MLTTLVLYSSLAAATQDPLAWLPEVHDNPLDLPLLEEQATPRIWNGTLVGPNELRGVVALLVAANSGGRLVGSTFCSGTLVHSEWVVTAAHCLSSVRQYQRQGYGIYVGIGTRWPYDELVPWHGYTAHPQYGSSGSGAGNDIGLVKLSKKVSAQTIAMNATTLGTSFLGSPVEVVGFGVTGSGAKDSGTKRRTTLNALTYTGDMVRLYNGSMVWNPTRQVYQVKAWDSTSNACSGDSGGASLSRRADGSWLLVGVNAVVFNGCENGGTGSTRVDRHIDWLRSYVPVGSPPPPPPPAPVDPDPDPDPVEETDPPPVDTDPPPGADTDPLADSDTDPLPGDETGELDESDLPDVDDTDPVDTDEPPASGGSNGGTGGGSTGPVVSCNHGGAPASGLALVLAALLGRRRRR